MLFNKFFFPPSSILNLPHQASPVSRTPSLPAVDTSYINTSLIQDYRHPFHMTPMPYDLQGEFWLHLHSSPGTHLIIKQK